MMPAPFRGGRVLQTYETLEFEHDDEERNE